MALQEHTRIRILRIVMFVTGVFLILGLPFMFDIWPGGFRWSHPAPHPAYERMIIVIYMALGLCLLLAVRDPVRNIIIIDFTIISSILHGGVMTYDAFAQEHELTHLAGDIPALFALAAILIMLRPKRASQGPP